VRGARRQAQHHVPRGGRGHVGDALPRAWRLVAPADLLPHGCVARRGSQLWGVWRGVCVLCPVVGACLRRPLLRAHPHVCLCSHPSLPQATRLARSTWRCTARCWAPTAPPSCTSCPRRAAPRPACPLRSTACPCCSPTPPWRCAHGWLCLVPCVRACKRSATHPRRTAAC
jgi:hypothetical protein